MKEQIEKKLGCSIEQFVENRKNQQKWAYENNLEIDAPTGLENLTEDEILFMAGYVKRMENNTQSA